MPIYITNIRKDSGAVAQALSASIRTESDGVTWTYGAEDVTVADLQAAVDAAPVYVEPVSEEERLESVESAVLPPDTGTPERVRYENVRQGALDAITPLRSLRDESAPQSILDIASGSGTMTTAQLSIALRVIASTQIQLITAVRTVAGVLVQIVRLALRQFDAEN